MGLEELKFEKRILCLVDLTFWVAEAIGYFSRLDFEQT